jgi:putative radical SAM enzyme (TIGR03279 family)
LTYFTEIDWSEKNGGFVAAVENASLAGEIGINTGDELLAINGNPLNDVIDVSYYGADEELEILVRRDGEYLLYEVERSYGQPLGIEFAHPTFDTDIRRCNNLCEFCFVLQMSPGFRRTLYIKDDDYRYSFLFGHFVTLTNLSEHDWWRIETMRLSPLYVSVHATDTELRRRFLRNDSAPDVIEQLKWLADRGIEIHTQIVVVPELNDGDVLIRSIEQLSALWPSVRSVSVVPVGLTKFHKYGMRAHTLEESVRILEQLTSLQNAYRENLGVNFAYATDEWFLVSGETIPSLEYYDGLQLQENGLGMVRGFFDEWNALKEELGSPAVKEKLGGSGISKVTMATGTLFAGTLAHIASEFSEISGIETEVIGVVNGALGDSITVAGLLNASDIIAALRESGYGDLVVLPYNAFDHPDRISLDNVTPMKVAESLGVHVALAQTMGDVLDAVIGKVTSDNR